MSREWSYGVRLCREGDEVQACCDDLPEAIASGTIEADARREMAETLVVAVRGRIEDGMDQFPPAPAKPSGPAIASPAWLAAKASPYDAWRESGLSEAALAERIGRSEAEVRTILYPDDFTGLDRLAEAAAALGGRLSIRFEAV